MERLQGDAPEAMRCLMGSERQRRAPIERVAAADVVVSLGVRLSASLTDRVGPAIFPFPRGPAASASEVQHP